MIVRPARPEEIPYLAAKALELGWERDDLDKTLVWVLEVDGVLSGFIDAEVVWKINNLAIFPEFRRAAPPILLRRCVLALVHAATSLFYFKAKLDEDKGLTPVRCFFAYIETKRFASLCRRWGILPLPRKGRWFGARF